jgi:hypothetical protein
MDQVYSRPPSSQLRPGLGFAEGLSEASANMAALIRRLLRRERRADKLVRLLLELDSAMHRRPQRSRLPLAGAPTRGG